MIITRTPLRISLIGGGTDLPSFYKKSPGAVVSFAINKYVYVITNKKFDGRYRISYSKLENVDDVKDIQHNIIRWTLTEAKINDGLEITTIADIPGTGSGLGSSSALTVGLLKSLPPYSSIEPGSLAEKAFMIEAELCGAPVGKQDQYASAYGGMNFMTFGKNNVNVRALTPSSEWVNLFRNSSLLLWTGITRDANNILSDQKKRFDDGGSIDVGKRLYSLAHEFFDEMCGKGRIKQLGELMDASWTLKKRLANGVTNLEIDRIYKAAMDEGAYGGKILGAGGGGFFFFLAPQYFHKAIIEKTGLKPIDFNIEQNGSEVVYGTGT